MMEERARAGWRPHDQLEPKATCPGEAKPIGPVFVDSRGNTGFLFQCASCLKFVAIRRVGDRSLLAFTLQPPLA